LTECCIRHFDNQSSQHLDNTISKAWDNSELKTFWEWGGSSTQGLACRLSHTLCFGYFSNKVLLYTWASLDCHPPIYTSTVARMTGVHHSTPLLSWLASNYNLLDLHLPCSQDHMQEPPCLVSELKKIFFFFW
jgi:hypothetical protein